MSVSISKLSNSGLDALKEKFLFDTNLGLESELSDEIVIWIYELMELRKIQIDREVKKQS